MMSRRSYWRCGCPLCCGEQTTVLLSIQHDAMRIECIRQLSHIVNTIAVLVTELFVCEMVWILRWSVLPDGVCVYGAMRLDEQPKGKFWEDTKHTEQDHRSDGNQKNTQRKSGGQCILWEDTPLSPTRVMVSTKSLWIWDMWLPLVAEELRHWVCSCSLGRLKWQRMFRTDHSGAVTDIWNMASVELSLLPCCIPPIYDFMVTWWRNLFGAETCLYNRLDRISIVLLAGKIAVINLVLMYDNDHIPRNWRMHLCKISPLLSSYGVYQHMFWRCCVSPGRYLMISIQVFVTP